MTDVHVLEVTVTDARGTLIGADPRFELFHAVTSIRLVLNGSIAAEHRPTR